MYSCAATSGPKLFCMFGLVTIVSSLSEGDAPRYREGRKILEEGAVEDGRKRVGEAKRTPLLSCIYGIETVPRGNQIPSAKRFTHGVNAQKPPQICSTCSINNQIYYIQWPSGFAPRVWAAGVLWHESQ